MLDEETLRRVRTDLGRHAEVFEDPGSYLDGVEDALDVLRRLVDDAEPRRPALGQ
jgi:hypothetical protein